MIARQPFRVLVIDDNADVVEVLALMLEHLKCVVERCANPRTCFDRARDFQPHLILLDISMRTWNGFAVAEALRSVFPPQCRLVAISDFDDYETENRCAVAGFWSVEVKPVSIDRLAQIVSQAISALAISS